jgi:hypothetical protein
MELAAYEEAERGSSDGRRSAVAGVDMPTMRSAVGVNHPGVSWGLQSVTDDRKIYSHDHGMRLPRVQPSRAGLPE